MYTFVLRKKTHYSYFCVYFSIVPLVENVILPNDLSISTSYESESKHYLNNILER